MQPVAAETNEKKSGLRKPPKYEIKADSFQSIQLKPVSRDPKTPQKAENGGIELKVFSREGDSKYICSIYIYISFSFALFLSHLYVFISFPSIFLCLLNVTCWIICQSSRIYKSFYFFIVTRKHILFSFSFSLTHTFNNSSLLRAYQMHRISILYDTLLIFHLSFSIQHYLCFSFSVSVTIIGNTNCRNIN